MCGSILLVGVMAAASGCGSSGSRASVSLQAGVPHCAAAESAAAREPPGPAPSDPTGSGSPGPSPMPTSGSRPPTPTPMATAIPTIVTAATLQLGPAELSTYPSAQYVVGIGTVVNVELPGETVPFCWSIPASTAPTVLAVMSQEDALNGGAHARFRAVAPGVATVVTTNACYTFPSCEAAEALTEAVVTVRP